MKIYMKLFSLIFIGITGLISVSGILQIRRETTLFREETRHDAKLLGNILANEISETLKNGGSIRRLKELLRSANYPGSRVRFRWVRFDAAQGSSETPEVEKSSLTVSSVNSVHIVEKQDTSGHKRAYYYFAVPLPNTLQGGLEVSESLSKIDQFTRDTVKHFIIMGSLLLVIVGLILAMGSFWLLAKPLTMIVKRTRDIRDGQLSGRLELNRHDEMGELALSINDMSEELLHDREKIHQEMQARIVALEQLRHADRLRSVGRLASGVAHELGTPLNVISGRAGLIAADNSASAEIAASAETIRGQCQRITSIIRQLLDFARRSKPRSEPSDLNQIISQTVALLKPLAMKQQVKIDYRGTEERVIVIVDGAQLEEVLTNLLTNAVQAMPKGGRTHVQIDETLARPPGQPQAIEKKYHVIRVQDEGIGISPNDLPHIFDPFFTTKDTGEGTGLGLSIAYGIVQEHGGWIEASSKLGHGSTFIVYLPSEETQ